ncbi:adenine nucleotide alpha hydrolase [Desulfoscipio gibsoniae]|uniref:Putative ATPase of the PP-loop superfamily implicated in cell cycle control n=1 Tax=Desulfoscipio gibsoniae DSM 7213 TaxID=767817 RepID=R4KIP1_9FIRM|nr:adenine nucleotide alpha hydrolase [Desulfoscipio gibsoniae]AGL03058.1 putative ATPase of the PP-loop superfamily implicated in cell cycle control [Desulfoscipio gibsoniae DSM 7213]
MKDSYLKWFKGKVKKAMTDYNMISDGDRVAVGLSGGKDSMALLHVLCLIRREVPVRYDLHAIFVNPGWPMDIDTLAGFCRQRDIPFTNKLTDIGEVVFNERKEKNPCALCANLRRGAINNTARDLGLNKLALGHHLDDAIETFLMSLIFTGQFRTFAPVTYMDRSGITLIRPMVYITGKTVETFVQRYNLPVVKSLCPVNGITKREEMKELVEMLSDRYPEFKTRFLTAFQTLDPSNLWPPMTGRDWRRGGAGEKN